MGTGSNVDAIKSRIEQQKRNVEAAKANLARANTPGEKEACKANLKRAKDFLAQLKEELKQAKR